MEGNINGKTQEKGTQEQGCDVAEVIKTIEKATLAQIPAKSRVRRYLILLS
jgi:hypothetical protein